MSATYALSVHRRIERHWAEGIKLLRQIRCQLALATERTLQIVFHNDGSLVLVPVKAVLDRRETRSVSPT
jgi:hypothetical protein